MSIAFTSCDKRQSAINNLENFSEELKENSSDYSSQDWEEANEQDQLLVEQIDVEFAFGAALRVGNIVARDCFFAGDLTNF